MTSSTTEEISKYEKSDSSSSDDYLSDSDECEYELVEESNYILEVVHKPYKPPSLLALYMNE